jgi:hypothetical protein
MSFKDLSEKKQKTFCSDKVIFWICVFAIGVIFGYTWC